MNVQFVGGPLDGQTYKPLPSTRFVEVPDAADTVSGYDPEFGDTFTLFGRHTHELKCYRKGDEVEYRLEHKGYAKPELPARAIRLPAWNEA